MLKRTKTANIQHPTTAMNAPKNYTARCELNRVNMKL